MEFRGALCHRSVEATPMCCSQMIGNDQFDTSAKRLLGRIAKQGARGTVPANDRSRVVSTDDSVGGVIENPLGQFGLLFHECTPVKSARPRPRDNRYTTPVMR